MIAEEFIYLGAALNVLAGFGYMGATIRGEARPNRVTWGLWSVTALLALLGQLDEGVGTARWLTLSVAAVPVMIFLASFVQIVRIADRVLLGVNHNAYWRAGPLDWGCAALAVLTLIAWKVTASGDVAIALSILADLLAGVPTMWKAYIEPASEVSGAYTAGMVNGGVTLLALPRWTFAEAGFAVYYFLLSATLAVLILVLPRFRPAADPTPAGHRTPLHAVVGRQSRLNAAEWVLPESSVRALRRRRLARRSALIVFGSTVGLSAFTFGGLLAWTTFVPGTPFAAAVTNPGVPFAALPAAEPPRPEPATPKQPVLVAASVPIPALGSTVEIGPTPGFVVASPSGRHAYVANRAARVVTVVDTAVNRVTAVIPVSAGPPQYLAFSPDGRRIYISIWDDARTVAAVGVLDTTSNAIVAIVPVRTRPFLVAVTPDGRQLYVPNHDSGTVSVIDTASHTLAAEIAVPANPHWVAFSRDGGRAYAANHESNVVAVIDTTSRVVIGQVPVGTSPHSVAVNPSRPLLAVANYGSGSVSIIDTDTDKVVATVPVGRNPQAVCWAPDGRHAYAVNNADDTVSVISADTRSVSATVPTGRSPTSMGLLPDGSTAYVTNLDDGTLTALHTAG